MIKLNYNSQHPNIIVKKWCALWYRLRQGLIRDVEIIDGDLSYRFRCGTLREYSRCVKMFIKEPGTCDWIRNNVKPGEVFFDIGANIGVYTILAAYHAGQKGKVYAFEPHSANFTRLLDNILENNLQNIVVPCNFALNDEQGFFPFNYLSGQAGFSNSQLSPNHKLSDGDDYHEISELKYAASIDSLIASGKFTAPHHIKIDVDGNELLILNGMRDLMRTSKRPISIQVEINKNDKADISRFMEQYDYILSAKHYTRAELKRRARGTDAEDGIYNAIFRQRT